MGRCWRHGLLGLRGADPAAVPGRSLQPDTVGQPVPDALDLPVSREGPPGGRPRGCDGRRRRHVAAVLDRAQLREERRSRAGSARRRLWCAPARDDGGPGRGAREKLALYNADMRDMFHEVARVLRPGARAAFVIGDATVDRAEYTTTEHMAGWAVAAGLEPERELRKTRTSITKQVTPSATARPSPGSGPRPVSASPPS